MVMRGLICLTMAAVSWVMLLACGQQNAGVEQTSAEQTVGLSAPATAEGVPATKEMSPRQTVSAHPPVTIAVTYDNNPYDDRLRTAWGFSCLVRLPERTILFDTGGDSSILLHNMEQLQIDPDEIDVVVLSHIHSDHVGGLGGILNQNSSVVVYLPASFPQGLKEDISRYGAEVQEVDEPRELFDGVYTTGELNGGIREQSLIVKTDEGLIVITGCAHPGVVNVVRKAREVAEDKVYLLIGGFHLGGASASKIEAIIDDFEQLGVERVAPCHCSGDTARILFREHYGEGYIECGVGRRIALPLEG
jgi:7,8-dihydropterin-6-yl-methyl-4-(beta-D-ribofuranosyl)aminobenzene 5'-phosphate synthase